MQKNVRLIARFAIIAALIVVAVTIDTAVSVGLPSKIAWVVLMVTLTIVQQFGFGSAVFAGTVFGLVSFLSAYIVPNLTSEFFRLPWVSILPRMAVGAVSYGVFYLLRKATARSSNTFVSSLMPRAVAGAAGVLTNTVLVLTMMALSKGTGVLDTVIGVIISVGFIPEFVIGILVVPTLSHVLSKQIKKMKI